MGVRARKLTHLIHVVFLGVLIMFLPVLLLISTNSPNSLPTYQGTVNAPETRWYFGEKDGELHPVDIQGKQFMEPQKTYVLSTRLNYDGRAEFYPSAMFLINNYGVRIYYEDQLIFQRMREDVDLPTVESLGMMAFSLPMGYDCQGKELRIELDPMLRSPDRKTLPDVQFGDYATSMRQIYIKSIPSLIVVSAILFLCIALLLIGGVHEEMRKKCLNLAWLAAAFSVYRLTESLFVQHMSKSPYLLYLCNYLALALLPIFLIHAYQSKFPAPFQRYIRLVEVVCWINFAGQLLLHFMRVMDMRRMLILTQLCCALVMISMLVPIVLRRKDPVVRRVTVEVLPFFFGTLLDTIAYFVESNRGNAWYSVGTYMSIGFLITLVVVIYEVRKTSEQAAAESLKSQFFQKMAYQDALTGLKNRAAFEEEVQKIASGEHPYHTLVCVSADLNGLKIVNDTHGHQEGDVLIRRCAELLEECFSGQGRVFRVGGDEFSVFLYDVTESDWPALKHHFEERMRAYNETESFPLSVAIGCAAVVDGDVEHALQLADQRMYQDKYAAKNRRDPRRTR